MSGRRETAEGVPRLSFFDRNGVHAGLQIAEYGLVH
jgi:hypothetical protein